MTDRLKVGLAGAGVFGGHHAGKYAQSEKADLVGVFDLDSVRADALAERFSTRSFQNYNDLLTEIDAIVIASPAVTHFRLAQAALAAGRHVFVEKPIALSSSDADQLVAAAEEKSLVLQVGHQERYVFEVVGLLDRAEAPRRIESIRKTTASGRCEDVSVVFDLMVHDLDLVRQLVPSELQSVTGGGERNRAHATLQFACGAEVAMAASRCAEAAERTMRVEYDDGEIEFDFVNRRIRNSTNAVLKDSFEMTTPPQAFSDPLGFGADLFVAAALDGGQAKVCGRAGRAAVAIAEKIEQAAGFVADPELKNQKADVA